VVPTVNLVNRAVTGNADTFWVSRKMGTNDMVFRGKVKNRRSSPINVTVNDPPMFFGALLQYRLKLAGVAVDHVVRPAADAQFPAGKTLHVIQTTIDQVLQRCNKDSQNLFAECLFKRMGRKVTGRPGSWDNGAAAMRLFLHDRLGARSAALTIADGSGMSRDNHVTARSLVEVLTAMVRDPRLSEPYVQSLSIGGVDGTLEHRFHDLKGATVLGKSGYISQVATLTGMVLVPDATRPSGHRTVMFSLLFNGFVPPIYLSTIHDLQDHIVGLIVQDMQSDLPKAKK
jgi:D-alanyl-D-alanine carboxypeptidase/D-alanyl-D-alanine-endopeptidase (penicillin-binding protein 4)